MFQSQDQLDTQMQTMDFDRKHADDFERNKREHCVALFMAHYPEAKDYDVAEFISRARRSYIRSKHKNISDAEWEERLKKHILSFKFVAPLQRQLEKLVINQELVSLEIEKAKLAKEKAKLEKERIDFLNEQANVVKNSKSSYYRHLATISELENSKRDLEANYRKELEELKEKKNEDLHRAVGSEVSKVKDYYDQRILKFSQFYELFKQKYQRLQEVNQQIQAQFDNKNNEIHALEIQIVKLQGEIQNRDNQIDNLTNEVQNKTIEIGEIKEAQPEIIEKQVNKEVEERVRAQTNKLNSILIEKEKMLLNELEKRRNEIEQALTLKQSEFEQLNSTLSEAEQVAKLASDELKRVKRDYDIVVYTNRELNQTVKVLQEKNENLTKEIEKTTSENEELDKLNSLLVKKYHDSEYIEEVNRKISNDLKKISKSQDHLNHLINSNRKISEKRLTNAFNNIKKDIDSVNESMGFINTSLIDKPEDKASPLFLANNDKNSKMISYERDVLCQSNQLRKSSILSSKKKLGNNKIKKQKPKKSKSSNSQHKLFNIK